MGSASKLIVAVKETGRDARVEFPRGISLAVKAVFGRCPVPGPVIRDRAGPRADRQT
jgi:hypothetical protein